LVSWLIGFSGGFGFHLLVVLLGHIFKSIFDIISKLVKRWKRGPVSGE
jgi:hypothetical protein